MYGPTVQQYIAAYRKETILIITAWFNKWNPPKIELLNFTLVPVREKTIFHKE